MLTNLTVDLLPKGPLRALYKYWLSKRNARSMPSRKDINPAELTPYLPHICLIDVEHNPLNFRGRLMGSETVRAMGKDVTGYYLDQIPNSETMRKNYTALVESRKPYLAHNRLNWSEKDYLEYFALGMPLSDNDKDVNMIFFGMLYSFPDDWEL